MKFLITVKKDQLFHTGMVNDEIVVKHAYLVDLHSRHPDFSIFKKEVRALLRCQENLKMVQLDLLYFVAKYYGESDDPCMSFSLEPRAILSHCLMHYRACFVLGEGNSRPMRFLDKSFEQVIIHQKVRQLSDKLVGHLDANSDVRTDTIHWNFDVTENGFIPTKPELLFSKILSLHKNEILEWQEHISCILKEVSRRLEELSIMINMNIEVIP